MARSVAHEAHLTCLLPSCLSAWLPCAADIALDSWSVSSSTTSLALRGEEFEWQDGLLLGAMLRQPPLWTMQAREAKRRREQQKREEREQREAERERRKRAAQSRLSVGKFFGGKSKGNGKGGAKVAVLPAASAAAVRRATWAGQS